MCIYLISNITLCLVCFLQYCNVYVIMPEVQLLLTDHQLARECLDYVTLQGKDLV